MSTVTKETIYLFTTTRNSLYKRDLLNVCCFADGWVVEFGYKPDYVPPALLLNPVERLDGHPVVIVFCEGLAPAETIAIASAGHRDCRYERPILRRRPWVPSKASTPESTVLGSLATIV